MILLFNRTNYFYEIRLKILTDICDVNVLLLFEIILDYNLDLTLSVKREIEYKVHIHVYMLYEIYNNYFRTKNPNLDRKLDSNLRNLDPYGRGLIREPGS